MRTVDRSPMIRVDVRFFAMFREMAGVSERSYELPSGSTAADLLARVVPSLNGEDAKWIGTIAINREHAPADRVLRHGDEVALIPPVAGG